MWFLLVIILQINPQTGPVVEEVHIVKTFDTGRECKDYMNATRASEIPPFHNLGCVKWGDIFV
jgi:hypothetical protein